MYKLLKIFCCPLLAAALVSSCKNIDVECPDPQDSVADYTVIFWGMCGGNDRGVAFDMLTLADNYVSGRIGDNVRISGLVKTTVDLAYPEEEDYDMTFSFDSGDLSGKTMDLDNFDPETMSEVYDYAFKVLDGRPYADVSYPLNSTDSLAAFIRRTAEEFPARNYVLMLLGHGGGFSPAEEAPLSKACLYDDYRDDDFLTADAVVSAVQKSGVKVQTIFTQCCLMATLENIAAYSRAFDYGILAAEVTFSEYFPEYLVKLSEAGDDEQKMQAASRALIDYYVGTLSDYPAYYSSHGFYDLRKTGQLLDAVKDIASWYSGNCKALQEEIENAVSKCIFCDNLEGEDTETLREERKFMQALINEEDISGLVGDMTFEEFMMDWALKMSDLVENSISYGFPMAHLLKVTAPEIENSATAAQKADLQTFTDKYMQVLKDMAYIRATPVPLDAGEDYEYIYASPTVNIFGLNELCFIPIMGRNPEENFTKFMDALDNEDVDTAGEMMDEMFGGTLFANEVTLQEAEANYTSSVFDREVGWSAFLRQLEVNPSVLYNPDRRQINEEEYSGL